MDLFVRGYVEDVVEIENLVTLEIRRLIRIELTLNDKPYYEGYAIVNQDGSDYQPSTFRTVPPPR